MSGGVEAVDDASAVEVRWFQRASFWVDAAALSLCVAAGATIGWVAPAELRASGQQPYFYQAEFGPAVALSCGLGLTNLESNEALAAFLLLKTDRFSCNQLPADVSTRPLNQLQAVSRYLEESVATVWAARGISWSGLDVLYAVLSAVVAGALFGLFRIAMNGFTAMAGTLLVISSPLHVDNLPHLRDYAKAPFLLVLLLLMALMIVGAVRVRRLATLAAVAGLVLGIGLGFRNDLLITIPPLLVILVLLVRRGYPYKVRLGCVGLFLSVFLAAGAPIIRAYGAGNNSGHFVMLGMMAPFDMPLGIRPGPYEIGPFYDDMYAAAQISSEVDHTRATSALRQIGSADYDRATTHVLLRVVRLLPADLLIRAWSASLQVLVAPFTPQAARLPVAYWWGWLNPRGAVSGYVPSLAPVVPGLTIAVLIGLALRHWKFAVGLAIFIAVFLGGAALQFHDRHYFYLGFVGWWIVLVAVSASVGWVFRSVHKLTAGTRQFALPTWENVRPVVILVAGVSCGLPVVFFTARHYQQAKVGALFNAYLRAPTRPMTVHRSIDGEAVLVAPDRGLFVGGDRLWEMSTAFLRFDFDGVNCAFASFPMTLRYRRTERAANFTATWTPGSLLSGRATVFVPVYRLTFPLGTGGVGSEEFEGLQLSRAQAACLTTVQLAQPPPDAPILLSAWLPVDWRSSPLFQQLRRPPWPVPATPLPRLYSLPESAPVSAALPSRAPTFTGFATRSPHLTATGSGWRISGKADNPFGYVGVSTSHVVGGGESAIVEGELQRGGVTIGLLDSSGQWMFYVNVVTPGPFTVVLNPASGAEVRLVLANDVPGGGMNEVTFSKVGWVVDPATTSRM